MAYPRNVWLFTDSILAFKQMGSISSFGFVFHMICFSILFFCPLITYSHPEFSCWSYPGSYCFKSFIAHIYRKTAAQVAVALPQPSPSHVPGEESSDTSTSRGTLGVSRHVVRRPRQPFPSFFVGYGGAWKRCCHMAHAGDLDYEHLWSESCLCFFWGWGWWFTRIDAQTEAFCEMSGTRRMDYQLKHFDTDSIGHE